jgi:SAM-dependent methyltransferase
VPASAPPQPEAPAVAAHYRALAPEYGRRANRACARAYADLVQRQLAGHHRVIEVGVGTSRALDPLVGARRVGCDASLAMLLASSRPDWLRVVALADRLPFADASLDGVVALNLLEHLSSPDAFFAEAARALAPGGRVVVVTPNGDLEWLLDALERLRLKLPEGPHRFLRRRELAALVPAAFRVDAHRGFLALPAGPPTFVRGVDRLLAGARGRGLFQYLVAERLAERAR